MFEAAEFEHKVDKHSFEAREPALREALLAAQTALKGADFAAVIVIAGPEGSGKGELLHRLVEWLDPRGLETHALREPSDEERARPPYWRFWRRLPADGRIGIFLGSWYADCGLANGDKKIDRDRLDLSLRRIADFERTLVADGTLLLKFWLHVTKAQQKKHFQALERDPHESWRVTKRDWELHAHYDDLIELAGEAVRRTSTGDAPWEIVAASDAEHRDLAMGERLLAALTERLARPAPPPIVKSARPAPPRANALASLDLSQRLDEHAYDEERHELQGRLGKLARGLLAARRSAVVVFEGPDAAGKGGSIRRVTRALDARFFRVHPIAAPTPEEAAHHYLWRFWQRLPHSGDVAIFDRSWYGRVLVERVEGFARPDEWKRAFAEINAFEEELADAGAVVVKLWLAIDAAEQLRRFESREEVAYKTYKSTPDDWRNRAQWDAYEAAANEMFERTSTDVAPWKLVPANDKRFARVEVLRTICERLECG